MRAAVIAALAFSLAGSLCAADVEDGWSNIRRVTRDRFYAVVLRDGRCESGSLVSANDQAIVIGDSGKERVIRRTDVLRVSDDSLYADTRDTVFSARSSWLDVKDVGPKGTEYLHILTKHGEEWKWQKPTVSDDSVSFEGRKVDWLAPRLWFNGLILGKISVLLYNSELAEDNSSVRCR